MIEPSAPAHSCPSGNWSYQKGKIQQTHSNRKATLTTPNFQWYSRTVADALITALDLNSTLRRSTAGEHLHTLASDLGQSTLTIHDARILLAQGIQEFKDLMTAYHEAGHVLAFLALTPRDRIRLDHVLFTGRQSEANVEAGVMYTWIAEPCWPDPTRPDEVLRELACILAGKHAEPHFSEHLHTKGSDLDDRAAVQELLEMLPEQARQDAEHEALALLERAGMQARVPELASFLYEQWTQGVTCTSFDAINAFLNEENER